jgi:methanogenic corrinoid protein MtbC1
MNLAALVARVMEERVEILWISVLMLPSALRVKELCDQLRRAGSNVKVVVGGAPFRFDEQLWQQVGAAAYGKTASDALIIARQLIQEAE